MGLWSPSPSPAAAPRGHTGCKRINELRPSSSAGLHTNRLFSKVKQGLLAERNSSKIAACGIAPFKKFCTVSSCKVAFPQKCPKMAFLALAKAGCTANTQQKNVALFVLPQERGCPGGRSVDQPLGCHSHCGPADVSRCPRAGLGRILPWLWHTRGACAHAAASGALSKQLARQQTFCE